MDDDQTELEQDEAIEESAPDETDDDADGDDEGAGALGDKGKQALGRMKDKWRAERDKRADLERRLAEAADGDEATKEKRATEARALERANDRIRRAEIKAAAKGVLTDPADAFRFLDLDQFEVDDDGNVDEDEIAEAIADLVKKKPYLAAQGSPRFQGDAGGGARKETRPRQLTDADLNRMSPAEINKARREGRLDNLLGAS